MIKRLLLTQIPPLVQEPDGTAHVTESRVTLDTLVTAFRNGATAEQIQDSFPTVSLRDIYGVIAYYLEHQDDVDEYLRTRRNEAEAIRRKIEARQDTAAFRARVRARREQEIKS
jgi:uncharacterized protein (DUF433 family)